MELHEEHTYEHVWKKRESEPEGWFPPGSYESLPETWTATYRCRGTQYHHHIDLTEGQTIWNAKCVFCGLILADGPCTGPRTKEAHQ